MKEVCTQKETAVGKVAQRGVAAAPSRATVHRVLVRNAMVTPQAQRA